MQVGQVSIEGKDVTTPNACSDSVSDREQNSSPSECALQQEKEDIRPQFSNAGRLLGDLAAELNHFVPQEINSLEGKQNIFFPNSICK